MADDWGIEAAEEEFRITGSITKNATTILNSIAILEQSEEDCEKHENDKERAIGWIKEYLELSEFCKIQEKGLELLKTALAQLED